MLVKRLSALGGVLLSLFLLSLGQDVEYGAEAYFFPNLISYFLFTFAFLLLLVDGELLSWIKNTVNFLWRWMFGIVGEGNPARWPDTVRLIPMFVIILGYLYAANVIGLYSSSFIAFSAITIIYTPVRPRSRTVIKNLCIGCIFTAVIYLIFSVLLQLQTPSTWLI